MIGAVCFICCYIEVCVCVCATPSHQVEVMNAIGSESKEKVEGKRGGTREEGGRESGKGGGTSVYCPLPDYSRVLGMSEGAAADVLRCVSHHTCNTVHPPLAEL